MASNRPWGYHANMQRPHKLGGGICNGVPCAVQPRCCFLDEFGHRQSRSQWMGGGDGILWLPRLPLCSCLHDPTLLQLGNFQHLHLADLFATTTISSAGITTFTTITLFAHAAPALVAARTNHLHVPSGLVPGSSEPEPC